MKTAPSGARTATPGRRSPTPSAAARGSRDFADLAAYRRFVDGVAGRRNARSAPRIGVERAAPREPPPRRTAGHEEAIVTVVASSGGFVLRKVFYGVPSRPIGNRPRARLSDDRLEVSLGGSHQMTLPRAAGRVRMASTAGHVVD
jgi:hypothetical protein